MLRYTFVSCLIVACLQCSEPKRVTAQIWVRGNCGMCKERIEATAKAVRGCLQAEYNVSSKYLTLQYDSVMVQEATFHQALADVGHATQTVSKNEEAHKALPECCKEGYRHP